MYFTEKSKKTIDACRFCWMCRHICPIGNATGMERNTARARALGLSMVARDVEKIDECVENVYECALCGACTKECLTAWDPTLFITEAKLEAVMTGATPEYVERMLENIEKAGNVYGKTESCAPLAEAVAALPENADVLLFLGKNAICQAGDQACEAIQLLKKAGLSFSVLADEPSSGWDLFFLVGGAEETRQTMKACAEALNAFKTVIAYDPNDARMFRRQFKEWGIELNAEVKTFTTVLDELITAGKLAPKKSDVVFTFQDPASLARDLEEIAPARNILNVCGATLEMLMNGKDTNLAGNLIMAQYMPEAMTKVAVRRWEEALRVGASTLVAANPDDYVALNAVKPQGTRVLTIEEVVLESL